MSEERSLASFATELASSAAARRGRMDVLLALHEVGAQALPVVALVAAFVGTNVTLVGASVFGQFGRTSDVGIFVALAGVREMVPVAACFMLAAKSGAAMAALVATMRLGGQLTALDAMAVDALYHLALPRFIATVLAAPMLIAIGNGICLGTGYLVAVQQLGVESAHYWEGVATYVSNYDLAVGLGKGLVFGGIIGLASLHRGFIAEPSPAGVGRAANHAVVASTVACIVVNYAITEACY